jgi:hypothetical protein
MPKTTPADLAVAFRSLSRRLREAVDAAESPPGSLVGELDALVAQAATLVGSAPDAAAVADAIEARPSSQWDIATLDTLRDLGVSAGSLLRRISERDS